MPDLEGQADAAIDRWGPGCTGNNPGTRPGCLPNRHQPTSPPEAGPVSGRRLVQASTRAATSFVGAGTYPPKGEPQEST
jgi:hypothetical protein